MELANSQQKMKVLEEDLRNKMVAKEAAEREVADLHDKIESLEKVRI